MCEPKVISEEDLIRIQKKFPDFVMVQYLLYTIRFWQGQAKDWKNKHDKLVIEGVQKDLEPLKKALMAGLGFL